MGTDPAPTKNAVQKLYLMICHPAQMEMTMPGHPAIALSSQDPARAGRPMCHN
jgi:hypothetical protein